MQIKPISLAQANSYIVNNHRHHDKVQGHKFSIGGYEGDRLCGVAVVGRPVSRHLDDGMTLEDAGLVFANERWKWSYLKEPPPKQTNLEEWSNEE